MAEHSVPLADFEREHVLRFWQIGLTSSEACRAWLRAPSASLLEDDGAQRAYRRGFDHEGRSLDLKVRGLVAFVDRAKLGKIAIAKTDHANYLVVRHPKHKTWHALIEEWGYGITVYSRWNKVQTINYDLAPSEQFFAQIVKLAQRASAERPLENGQAGPDFVDPESPSVFVRGEEKSVHPPDLLDRLVAWWRDFWG